MNDDVVRNLRLAVAASLLSVWGVTHLASIPVLGDTVLPLFLALLIAPGSPFAAWRANRTGTVVLLAGLLALCALTWLLLRLGSRSELLAFSHSPWFVGPVWALGLFGLVRNASAVGRPAAASASDGAAGALPEPVAQPRRR